MVDVASLRELAGSVKGDADLLRRMVGLAKFGGEETGVRVKAPDLLVADLDESAAAILALLDDVERLRDHLEDIKKWSEAYPLAVFPEPDLKKARTLLEAGGMTLDAISASCMRHVVKGVGEIARAALSAHP